MRILHTADWQIGAHLAFLGEGAAAAREKRFETVATLVDLAVAEAVDCVLVAGDVFDSPDLSEASLRRVLTLLEGLGDVPVVLLPGNHDPSVPGGVWDRALWKHVPSNVLRALTPRELEVREDLAVYPCPVRQKSSRLDPTRWIPKRADGDQRYRVGLAHGALDVLPHRGNFPIGTGRAEEAGLDYLALGDWHTPMVQGRIAYSGSPEPGSFRERDSGHALIVDLPEPGAEPQIEQRRVAALAWQKLVRRIDHEADLGALARALHPLRSELVLDLQVEIGDTQLVAAVEDFVEELRAEAFFLRSDCQALPQRSLDDLGQPLASELDAELLQALHDLENGGSRQNAGALQVDGAALTLEELVEARRQLSLLAQRASDGATR